MAALAAMVGGLFSGGLGQTLGLVGTAVSTLGTIQAGRQQSAMFEYQKEIAEQNADEATAAAQREAEAKRREGRFIQSRQRAAVAAGGGSVADPSVLDIMSDTGQAVDLAARTELYKGDQQARGYTDAAKVAGVNAKNAMSAAYLGAAGNLFSGVSSMYSRFGQQQRRADPAAAVMLPYG